MSFWLSKGFVLGAIGTTLSVSALGVGSYVLYSKVIANRNDKPTSNQQILNNHLPDNIQLPDVPDKPTVNTHDQSPDLGDKNPTDQLSNKPDQGASTVNSPSTNTPVPSPDQQNQPQQSQSTSPNPAPDQQPPRQQPIQVQQDITAPKQIPNDISKYLTTRIINLVGESTTSGNIFTSSGFILGPATQLTLQGKEHVYYLTVDLRTLKWFIDNNNPLRVYYSLKPYKVSSSNQHFYPLSFNPEWNWKALNIHYEDKPGEYFKHKDSLGFNLGVIMVDIDPYTSGRIKDQYQPKTLQISDNSNQSFSSYLSDLQDNMKKYGDVVINNKDINDGYMLSYKPDTQGSNQISPYLEHFPNLDKNKPVKRDFDQDESIDYDGKNWFFPSVDYQLNITDDRGEILVGSPLISYNDTGDNDSTRFSLSGISTKLIKDHSANTTMIYVSKLIENDDYDLVSEDSDTSDLPLCFSISTNKEKHSGWLDSGYSSKGISNYYPHYCH